MAGAFDVPITDTSSVKVRDVFTITHGGKVVGEAMVLSVGKNSITLVPKAGAAAHAGDHAAFARHAAAIPEGGSPSHGLTTVGQPSAASPSPAHSPTTVQGKNGMTITIRQGDKTTTYGPNGAQSAHAAGPACQLMGISMASDSTHNGFLRIQGRIRNATDKPLQGVKLIWAAWDEGAPTRTDPFTGETVSSGAVYSTYNFDVGTLGPGEARDIDILTSIASPKRIEGNTITLERVNSDPSQIDNNRTLRTGFVGHADNWP
jgi:hypothetical protein